MLFRRDPAVNPENEGPNPAALRRVCARRDAGSRIIAVVTDIDPRVRPADLPANALLARYRDGGGFTDCHVVDAPLVVTHPAFVEAFLTTALFAVERLLLGVFARRPSTREQARLLASGRGDGFEFAAWTVEARAPRQLLLRDFTGRTRTWLMTEPIGAAATRLYLGSAVLPRHVDAQGRSEMGATFRALTGFHDAYSRALLAAARARLVRAAAKGTASAGLAHDASDAGLAHEAGSDLEAGLANDATIAHHADRDAIARPDPAAPSASASASASAAPAHPAQPRRPRGGPPYRARPTRDQIAEMPPFESLPLERITLLETPAQCESALRALQRARFVGFDTESKPTFTRDAVRDGPHVIQFATLERGYVVQVNARTPIDFLRAVLDTEAIVKVGFGLDSDQAPLEHKLGLKLRGTVEVSRVLRRLGHKDALGAKAAVAVVLGRRLQKSKTVQTSNWGAAVLTPQQIRYAANDAYAALKVFEAMGSPYPA